MSYYRRPMGDYRTYGYAGDPGFLSSLWKGVKAVGKMVLGIPPKVAPTVVPIMAGAGAAQMLSPYAGPAAPGIPTGFGPGSKPGLIPTSQGWSPAEQRPAGYHPAKDGSGRWVRNRRMNVANPRALRKAMRRVQGFEKLAKRTIQFTRRTRMKK